MQSNTKLVYTIPLNYYITVVQFDFIVIWYLPGINLFDLELFLRTLLDFMDILIGIIVYWKKQTLVYCVGDKHSCNFYWFSSRANDFKFAVPNWIIFLYGEALNVVFENIPSFIMH